MEPRDDRAAAGCGAPAGSRRAEAYSRAVDDDAVRRLTLRGLLRFREADDWGIALDDVEPASELVKRFVDRGDVTRVDLP